jgi:hypothetical protein
MVQEQFVGFDVSQSETAICVVDGVGKVVWQGKCASTPEAMAVAVRRRAPQSTCPAPSTAQNCFGSDARSNNSFASIRGV